MKAFAAQYLRGKRLGLRRERRRNGGALLWDIRWELPGKRLGDHDLNSGGEWIGASAWRRVHRGWAGELRRFVEALPQRAAASSDTLRIRVSRFSAPFMPMGRHIHIREKWRFREWVSWGVG